MNMQSVLNFVIEVVTELYDAGVTEDGETYIAEAYFVRATDRNGNRWAYPPAFRGVDKQVDPEGNVHYGDVRTEAGAEAIKTLNAIIERGVVNIDAWYVVDPEYGSVAYQQYGEADQLAREKEEG